MYAMNGRCRVFEQVMLDYADLAYRVRGLESLVRYMANTLHQNYHPSGYGWQECDKALCQEAQKALGIGREVPDA